MLRDIVAWIARRQTGNSYVKAKKRLATRKKVAKRAKQRSKLSRKVSKRGKPSDQPSRKKAAKRGTPNKRPRKTVAKMAPRKPPRQKAAVVEDTIIDVVDEPVPGVVRITEYETIMTTTPKRGGPETDE